MVWKGCVESGEKAVGGRGEGDDVAAEAGGKLAGLVFKVRGGDAAHGGEVD